MSLTYKNQPEIRSVLGGLSTIIARVIVFAYMLTQTRSVFKQEYTLQTSVSKTDLTTDLTMYNITRDKFDFAIKLDYLSKDYEPNIFENLD